MRQDDINDEIRIMEIAPELPHETKNQYGETVPNFLGCLQKYLGKQNEHLAISERWKNKTNNDYIRNYYRARILKYIDLTKPISDFTDEDIDDLMDMIGAETGIENKPSVIPRCRQLFWAVYEAGFTHGDYDDQLFWKRRGLVADERESEDSIEGKRRRRQLSRKSLEIKEETRLFKRLCSVDPKTEDGRTYGVMLMFFLGLRNNEAAGASFDNIIQVPGKEFHALSIIKTTVENTNKLKIGGKTYNAARILPLFPFLRDMLFERLKAITGKNDVDEAMLIAGTWPIACRGTTFESRCTRDDISAKARSLFKELGILDKQQYTYTEAALAEIMREKLRELEIEEKNVTAYLLRRGTATHLYCLGMAPSQIQYFIGHEVEDQNELRNYFTNPDRLEILFNILRKHPFCSLDKGVVSTTTLTLKARRKTFVRITADEPGQTIILRNSTPEKLTVIKSDAYEKYRQCIDISSMTDKIYLKTMKAIEEEDQENSCEGHTSDTL